MSTYYFDSSGIAKRYETGSGWVRSIIAEAENTIVIVEIGAVGGSRGPRQNAAKRTNHH